MSVPLSRIVFQRDGSMLLSSGYGQQELLEIVRGVAVLRQAVGDSFVFELSPLALWGAAATGRSASEVLRILDAHSVQGVPSRVAASIAETMGRFGALVLESENDGAVLRARDPTILDRIGIDARRHDGDRIRLNDSEVSSMLINAARLNWPIVDRRTPRPSACHVVHLRATLRPYQRQAVDAFSGAGSGLILLPCGAGKTLVGVAAAVKAGGRILVLVPSRSVATQWRDEFIANTSLVPDQVVVAPSRNADSVVTISTYHAATIGRSAAQLLATEWSLVIFDEVQMLPANVFREAASIRANNRLGLTATLVREDGREREVAGLVGPPIFTISWKELERQGWIAPARCIEVRIPFSESAADRQRFKLATLQRLLHKHGEEQVVVAGTSVASLGLAGRRLGFPVLTGASPDEERNSRYEELRAGRIAVLGVSRIGSIGVDVPDASVLIQLSGTFGSRQEEAQRLGRVLRFRPGKVAHLYSLVSDGTSEVEFAARRRRFLVDQGYAYEILRAEDIPRAVDSESSTT